MTGNNTAAIPPNLAPAATPAVAARRLALVAMLPQGSVVAAAGTPDRSLPELSMQELLEMDVSLVARRPQRIQETPAAVTVLSAEQIRRSGARSIPELLRYVPGLAVAELGDGHWAIAARGFNSRFSNKLQVLMDGCSIYSPLFSGVFWEAVDLPLDDIERIEVIRGPGAVMWGANAMNGVINIVTRKARDTTGTAVNLAADSPTGWQGSVRQGLALDETHGLRLYAKAERLSSAPAVADGRSTPSGERYDTGFRLDGGGATRRWTLDGQALRLDHAERWGVPRLTAPWQDVVDVASRQTLGHLQLRHEWGAPRTPEVTFSASAASSVLESSPYIRESRTTFDAELQWRLQPLAHHDVLLGAGYRTSRDQVDGSALIDMIPARQSFTVASVFAHDEVQLVAQTLRVDLGLRLEHNTYNGLLPQGGVRGVWTPSPQQTLWVALAHAVRTPSRAELGARIDTYLYPPGTVLPGPLPVLASVRPHTAFDLPAETLDEIDAGWRTTLGGHGWLDVTVYSGRYRDLVMSSLGAPRIEAPPPHVVLPVITDVRGRGRTRGAELSLDWEITPGWRASGQYSFLDLHIDRPGNLVGDGLAALYEGYSPRHQFGAGVSWDPTPGWKLDVRARHVGELVTGPVAGYSALDFRIAWKPRRDVEIELVGRNLGDRRHAEMRSTYLPALPMEIERSIGLGLRWTP